MLIRQVQIVIGKVDPVLDRVIERFGLAMRISRCEFTKTMATANLSPEVSDRDFRIASARGARLNEESKTGHHQPPILNNGGRHYNVSVRIAKNLTLYQVYVAGKIFEMALASSKFLRQVCLLYTSPSPRDKRQSRMPSSA